MSTWTLVIMLLAGYNDSMAMTHVAGFASQSTCQAQAQQLNQVRVDNGRRRVQTICVEVK